MPQRFICDVRIPPRLAALLRTQGFDAAHVFDVGLATATDAEIWSHAKDRDAIIVTKDKDFSRMDVTESGPCVILVCLGNCSNRLLLDKFCNSLAAILAHFQGGKRVVELR